MRIGLTHRDVVLSGKHRFVVGYSGGDNNQFDLKLTKANEGEKMQLYPIIYSWVLTRTRLGSLVLVVLLYSLLPMKVATASSLNKSQVERRLDYLVGVTSFSNQKPLSQERLMELLNTVGFWGGFPDRYKSGITNSSSVRQMMPGCDDYITRPMARRFLHDLLDKDLRIWETPEHGIKAIIQDNKLGWYYNNATTMREPPMIHVTSIRNFGKRINCEFRITHKIGSLNNPDFTPPDTFVGTGTAVLEQRGSDWVVTSWQVNRNRSWTYNLVN